MLVIVREFFFDEILYAGDMPYDSAIEIAELDDEPDEYA